MLFHQYSESLCQICGLLFINYTERVKYKNYYIFEEFGRYIYLHGSVSLDNTDSLFFKLVPSLMMTTTPREFLAVLLAIHDVG